MGSMLAFMVSDTLVYRAAVRIIERFETQALTEVNRLVRDAVGHNDRDQAVLMVRIRLAIKVLQTPPAGPLH
jgi:hypothetical protein